jgi:hypothetical protein
MVLNTHSQFLMLAWLWGRVSSVIKVCNIPLVSYVAVLKWRAASVVIPRFPAKLIRSELEDHALP